jgi:hypothetical protein
MLTSEEWRFAIEDARTRHAGMLELVAATDQQAMSLISLYVTLGLATASGFVASIAHDGAIPDVLTFPLLGATIMFVLGTYNCFKTLETARVNLPGRTADFWLWASSDKITSVKAFQEYLTVLQSKHALNDSLNLNCALSVRKARQYGLAAPVVAVAIGIAIEGLKLI